MANVLALVDDIFFQARIDAVARATRVQLQTVAAPDALVRKVQSELPSLVIVDLNLQASPLEAIHEIRREHPVLTIIGFLSHVQTDLAVAARAAGCSDVMPRSQFTQELATLLRTACS